MSDPTRSLRQAELKRAFEAAQLASIQVKQTYSTLRFSTRTIEDSQRQMSRYGGYQASLSVMRQKAAKFKTLYADLSQSAESSYRELEKASFRTAGLTVLRVMTAASKLVELLTAVGQAKALAGNLSHLLLHDTGLKNKFGVALKVKELPGIADAGVKQEYAAGIGKVLGLLGAKRTGAFVTMLDEFNKLRVQADKYAKRGHASTDDLEQVYKVIKACADLLDEFGGTKAGTILGPIGNFVDLVKEIKQLYDEVTELSRLAQELGGSCRFRETLVSGSTAPTSGSIVAYAKLIMDEQKLTARDRKLALMQFGREIRNESQARAWEDQLSAEADQAKQELVQLRKTLTKRTAVRAQACGRLMKMIEMYSAAVCNVYLKLEEVKQVEGHSPLDIESAERHMNRLIEYSSQAGIWLSADAVGFDHRFSNLTNVLGR